MKPLINVLNVVDLPVFIEHLVVKGFGKMTWDPTFLIGTKLYKAIQKYQRTML